MKEKGSIKQGFRIINIQTEKLARGSETWGKKTLFVDAARAAL